MQKYWRVRATTSEEPSSGNRRAISRCDFVPSRLEIVGQWSIDLARSSNLEPSRCIDTPGLRRRFLSPDCCLELNFQIIEYLRGKRSGTWMQSLRAVRFFNQARGSVSAICKVRSDCTYLARESERRNIFISFFFLCSINWVVHV